MRPSSLYILAALAGMSAAGGAPGPRPDRHYGYLGRVRGRRWAGSRGTRGVTSEPCRTCKAAVGEPCDPSTLGKYPQHRSRLEDSKQ